MASSITRVVLKGGRRKYRVGDLRGGRYVERGEKELKFWRRDRRLASSTKEK